jgi:hypothetical protein
MNAETSLGDVNFTRLNGGRTETSMLICPPGDVREMFAPIGHMALVSALVSNAGILEKTEADRGYGHSLPAPDFQQQSCLLLSVLQGRIIYRQVITLQVRCL